MYDLLTEPLLDIRKTDGQDARVTLPGLMSVMMRGNLETIWSQRPHQRHALHSFLAQTGAAALELAGAREIPEDEAHWLQLLEALTGHPGHEPWQLIHEDLTAPAFLQPPTMNPDSILNSRLEAPTPGSLDILASSKNHEVKRNTVRNAEPQDWFMALVSLQTQENYSGSGRKGISRIQNGEVSRPALSIMPLERNFGLEVRRDILALQQALPAIREEYPRYPHRGGTATPWTIPWEGAPEETLTQESLHALYVDLSRRVRLITRNGRISALYTGTKGIRIERPRGGLTGDPWAPVNTTTKSILKMNRPGEFTYQRISQLLFSEHWQRPPLLEPTPAELEVREPMRVVARCIPRKQGRTFGYQERHLTARPSLQHALADPPARQDAADISGSRIKQIGEAQWNLKSALRAYLRSGKPPPRQREQDRSQNQLMLEQASATLDATIDRDYFKDLQDELEAAPDQRDAIRQQWLRNTLGPNTRDTLREYLDILPCQNSLEQRARAVALNIFEGWLHGPQGPLHPTQPEPGLAEPGLAEPEPENEDEQ